MDNEEKKFCKDCKYYDVPDGHMSAVCMHKKASQLDLVTGDTTHMTCWLMRTQSACDERGKLWEPRNV